MKKYTIKRINCREGIIQEVTTDGSKKDGEVQDYGKCLDWVLQNQVELRAYKIARLLHRKNAKRRLLKVIYVENADDAIRTFDETLFLGPDADYQLLTGDWKLIAHKTVINNVQGFTIII